MKAPDSLIFDLDGTLWDTCPACALGWNEVLARHGIAFREIHADDVRRVAGRPHDDCIRMTFAGLPEEQIRILCDETQEADMQAIRRVGGSLYPDVENGVKRLARHTPLFIVSNCQAGYIETFLEMSQLGTFFRDFECWGNTGRSKNENLSLLIERNGLRAPVYIGDTLGDQNVAQLCQVPFAHVTYGFGRCEKSDRQFNSFAELVAAFDNF